MSSTDPRSPFYRVGVKCLIFDDQDRLLMVLNDENEWEVPGGGWEHGESLEECVARELQEELGVSPATISKLEFAYPSLSSRGYMAMRLAVRATLASTDFQPSDGMQAARYVSREELLELPMSHSEAAIKDYLDQVWRTVA